MDEQAKRWCWVNFLGLLQLRSAYGLTPLQRSTLTSTISKCQIKSLLVHLTDARVSEVQLARTSFYRACLTSFPPTIPYRNSRSIKTIPQESG